MSMAYVETDRHVARELGSTGRASVDVKAQFFCCASISRVSRFAYLTICCTSSAPGTVYAVKPIRHGTLRRIGDSDINIVTMQLKTRHD